MIVPGPGPVLASMSAMLAAHLRRAAVFLMAAASASGVASAQQFVTDDAAIVDRGACQVEAWYARPASWALPACQFIPNVEVTAGVGTVKMPGGTRETRYVLQGKTLVPDGLVGNRTVGQAMMLGFEVVKDASAGRESANWPPAPRFKPLLSTAARQAVFGKFRFEHHPVPGHPENIRVLDGWAEEHIGTVRLPLGGIMGAPANGRIQFHEKAIPQLERLWAEWKEHGLLSRIRTWDGSYLPRFIRGSTSSLSNHAFGTAFDINAVWNALGAQPAIVGRDGSVRELVAIANRHGFYWGGHFSRRPDGMHFEVAVVKPV